MRKPTYWIISIALSIGLVACRNSQLNPLSLKSPVSLEYIDVLAKFCTSDRTVAKQKVKYMFILDHSRSNQPVIPDPNTPNDQSNTDPDGARRYGALVQFLGNLIPDPNNLTYFSLIDFDTRAYLPQGLTGFVQDPQTFIGTYMRPDWIGGGTAANPAPIDGGFTNYLSALKLAVRVIKDDADAELQLASSSQYMITYHIIFVTDGVPTVTNGSGVTIQGYNDIAPGIVDLMNIKNDPNYQNLVAGVELNTAYYYTSTIDPDAQALLQQMAVNGNGQYMEFGGTQGIMYQSFAPPARHIKMNLADIWIENQNVVAWEDGRLLPDLDADGLPDEIESKLGSNLQLYDSDGNGVNDLVEYRTKGVACKAAGCTFAGRDPYSICDGFSPITDSAGRVTFKSTSNDGLNDCEKFLIGAEKTTFDSNGDFIPDKLAFVNNIPFMAGTSGVYLNPFGDKLNHYSKLKIGLPVNISEKNLLNFIPRKNSLLHETSDNPDVECYRYTAEKVAVMRPGDVIRVYLIQNHSIINNKPILTKTSKSWRAGDKTLVFERGEFN